MKTYFVYLLLCADNTFYTGICTDPIRRLREHNHTKKGARYTRARRPVKLIYQEECIGRAAALSREHSLRQLNHQQKASLAQIALPN